MKNSKFEIRNIKLKKRKAFFILAAAAVVFLLILPSRQSSQNPSYTSPVPQLTEDEKYILNPPLANASSSAKEKHRTIVASLAEQTNSIEIKDCKPNPIVVETTLGTDIKIMNKDNIERKIIIDSKHILNIPAGSEKIVKTQFKYGAGDYGYVCEGSGIVGFMHVTDTE